LVGLVGLSVWLIACGGGERIPGAAVVVTGSGSTRVTPIPVKAGTTVTRIDANTFDIPGVGTVRSPVNVDTIITDGKLNTDVLVIKEGSAPLGFAGFFTDSKAVVVQIRTRQTASVEVRINNSGALLENVALPPLPSTQKYVVTVKNVILSSGGNQLRINDEMTYAFSVFKDSEGKLRHTLPTAVSYRLPVVGQPVENVFLELTVDPAAKDAKGSLTVKHVNGEINLTNVPVVVTDRKDGKVTFKAQPGGPTLGTVSSVTVSVLLPPPPSPSP
jgi:hypothetical protein